MHKVYSIPAGSYPAIYQRIAKETHTLIAGATGSGKSVIINGIIYSLLHDVDMPDIVLLDPKKVELALYRQLPHCKQFADNPGDITAALESCLLDIERRYRKMQRTYCRVWPGKQCYIFIDEIADLMCSKEYKTRFTRSLQRICQIGRAAGYHVIAATQCPIAEVIPTVIKVNFTCVIALHCRSAQDSRNIIGIPGAEMLPAHGTALILSCFSGIQSVQAYIMPMVAESKLQQIVEYYRFQKPKIRLF